jgi:dTDP-4-dehydrorhamnose reductase
MKIWIIGSGMLGRELHDIALEQDHELSLTDREVSLLDIIALTNHAASFKPEAVINCAAYTAVDKAESESQAAFAINAQGPLNLAHLTAQLNIPLVHISTDYVFTGLKSGPLQEDDPTGPSSVYGKSKLLGEQNIQEQAPRHYILRTSWLYGKYGPNFVKTMLRLMNEKPELKIVNDQEGCPTWTRDLASAILTILKLKPQYGVYHYANEGVTTWFGFASEILKLAQQKQLLKQNPKLMPVSTAEFPTPATRPKNSALSKQKIKSACNLKIPLWQQSLNSYLSDPYE